MAGECPSCGAVYSAPGDSCAQRFDELLALDHSRREPWGSRHAAAVSVFALQHADRFDRKVLRRGWLLLYSVYEEGRELQRVTAAFRRMGNREPDWAIPTLPDGTPLHAFDMTIADLGSFDAATYPELLERWCKVTLAHWRIVRPGSQTRGGARPAVQDTPSSQRAGDTVFTPPFGDGW